MVCWPRRSFAAAPRTNAERSDPRILPRDPAPPRLCAVAGLVEAVLARGASDADSALIALCAAMNHAPGARAAINEDAGSGDPEARLLAEWMAANGLCAAPVRPLPPRLAQRLHRTLESDPTGFLAAGDRPWPCSAGPEHLGFAPGWVASLLARTGPRLARFVAERRSDTAVLVGNGPSLHATPLAALERQDVYVTNYALEHATLNRLARGVAVTNRFVAAQAPELFGLFAGWSAYPVWLSDLVPDSGTTLWLPAVGGPLYFAEAPLRAIAWHSTVSYFWMQLLHHAGYRRIVLVGFDNHYVQPPGAREGDLLELGQDDPNHFDTGYFRNKTWQAADTERMAQTYALARKVVEAAGGTIVNATVGGRLEVFPRQPLEAALAEARPAA
jgi:hypothetical protein